MLLHMIKIKKKERLYDRECTFISAIFSKELHIFLRHKGIISKPMMKFDFSAFNTMITYLRWKILIVTFLRNNDFHAK